MAAQGAPGKRDRSRTALAPLLDNRAASAELERHLLDNSGLPGPRANLELAAAFADEVAVRGLDTWMWALLDRWVGLALDGSDPRLEYLPVCALQALGAAYPRSSEDTKERVLVALRHSAVDPRWRVRESVAMGLQRLSEADLGSFSRIVSEWRYDPSTLVRRAVVAALAHPPILRDEAAARLALEVTSGIISAYGETPPGERRGEDFQVLRRALEYAPSVVVAALPDAGFEWLRQVAAAADRDVRRIVVTNLGKARLAKRYPTEVAEVLACQSC